MSTLIFIPFYSDDAAALKSINLLDNFEWVNKGFPLLLSHQDIETITSPMIDFQTIKNYNFYFNYVYSSKFKTFDYYDEYKSKDFNNFTPNHQLLHHISLRQIMRSSNDLGSTYYYYSGSLSLPAFQPIRIHISKSETIVIAPSEQHFK